MGLSLGATFPGTERLWPMKPAPVFYNFHGTNGVSTKFPDRSTFLKSRVSGYGYAIFRTDIFVALSEIYIFFLKKRGLGN